MVGNQVTNCLRSRVNVVKVQTTTRVAVWRQGGDDLGTAKVETGAVRKDSRQVVESGTFGLRNGCGSPPWMLSQPARLRTHSSLLIGVLQIRVMTCGHQCKGHAQSRTRLHHGVDASNALSVLASGSGYYSSIVRGVQEREFLRARVITRSCGVAPDGAV